MWTPTSIATTLRLSPENTVIVDCFKLQQYLLQSVKVSDCPITGFLSSLKVSVMHLHLVYNFDDNSAQITVFSRGFDDQTKCVWIINQTAKQR